MDIKFYSDDQAVVEFFPVQPANKVVPEWYKEMPIRRKNSFEKIDVPTIKNCMPVQDMLIAGYIIFNTYELILHPDKTAGKYEDFKVSVPHRPYVGGHHHEQCPIAIEGSAKQYFKIAQPWLIKTPPGYSCLITQPFYQFEERFQLFPAIVDTDVHDLLIELPGYLTSDKEVKINSGEPLVQVIPFKRESWNMSCEYHPAKRSKLEFFLESAYRKMFHKKKVYR
jgi:hypothetical protein